jgi:hypothetical protein
VPATVLPNNLDTETKTSDCTPKEIYAEIIKMSSQEALALIDKKNFTFYFNSSRVWGILIIL